MWFSSLSHNRPSSLSGEPRRAHGSPRRRAACWPAVAALGLLGGLATPDTHAVTAATFGNPISTAVPNSYSLVAMATGDINGDGKPDVVAAANLGVPGQLAGVYVMLGRGDGSFTTPTLWPWAYTGVDLGPILALAVADLNGDQKPDIVTAHAFVGSGTDTPYAMINVWLQTQTKKGNFGFGNQQAFGIWSYSYQGPTSVTVSDVDGSGKPEIIVGSGGAVDVWRYGSGLLQHYSVPGGFGWYYSPAAVGDVNGDGKPDVVASGGTEVDVLLNQGGNLGFAAAQTYAVAGVATSVALGDVNGDGKLDIVTANSGNGSVDVLLNNGDGTFGTAQVYAVAGSPNSIALGDFNGDGRLDIATNGTEVDVLLNNGDGTFGTAQAVGPAGRSVVVADFNGDGFADIAQIDGSGTSVDVILNTSTPPSGGKKH
jgi:hypothetical protein